jgi:hypothetical protein
MPADNDPGSLGGARNGDVILCPSLGDDVAAAAGEFDRCFAAAAAQPTPERLDALRDATDRLMRACARVLIELGRSEDEQT